MAEPTLPYKPAILEEVIGPWLLNEEKGHHSLESEILPNWLPSRRWFGGKSRAIEKLAIEGCVAWAESSASVLAICVDYAAGPPDRYLVPLAYGPAAEFDGEAGVLARDNASNVLCDALFSRAFRANLLQLIASGSSVGAAGNVILGTRGKFLGSIDPREIAESRVLGVEQSNTSVLYGRRLFLKLFRRLHAGLNPDAEITRFLSERQGFAYVPPYAGELEARFGNASYPVGLMLGCVENRGDAWSWALKTLAKYYEGVDQRPAFQRIADLGRHTAEMHRALVAESGDDAFRPEPLTSTDFTQLAESLNARLNALIPILRDKQAPGDSLAREVLDRESAVRESISGLRSLPAGAAKTRHHGDYHLGQVLDTGSDWIIIDFEGEPTRSLAERRLKRSPIRDVAGMLRSLHYAAHSACPSGAANGQRRAEEWTDFASAAFLNRYFESAEGAAFLPAKPADRMSLVRAYVLEKALYEIDYELNNRPDWLPIPLRGLLRALKD